MTWRSTISGTHSFMSAQAGWPFIDVPPNVVCCSPTNMLISWRCGASKSRVAFPRPGPLPLYVLTFGMAGDQCATRSFDFRGSHQNDRVTVSLVDFAHRPA